MANHNSSLMYNRLGEPLKTLPSDKKDKPPSAKSYSDLTATL
jgi:hypothetical protein